MKNRKIVCVAILVLALAAICFIMAARLTSVPISNASADASVTAAPFEQTPVTTSTPTPEAAEEPSSVPLMQSEFTYKGSTIYMLTVSDPSRVFVGVSVTSGYWGPGNGKCLDVLADEYDAVGGMNAGSFVDMNGTGQGWPPEGITYGEGVCYNPSPNGELAGLDGVGKMHVGWLDNDYCLNVGIRDAVSFGPTLVADGKKADSSTLGESVYPRSAIGQKADGSIVFMVADGRQGYSIGLTLQDCADIMYSCGCINAVNMDGGNSSAMYMQGGMVNNPANPAGGTRYLPEAWLIRKSGAEDENVIEDGAVSQPDDPKGAMDCRECDSATAAALSDFAAVFVDPYVNYFGTQYADYYYPLLKRCCKSGGDLIHRADLALNDRQYVSTGSNTIENFSVNSIREYADGTYAVDCSYDIAEYATYWQYSRTVKLTMYIEKSDESYYGFCVDEVK